MTNVLDALPIDGTLEAFRRFWGWWSGELLAAIPARLRTLLNPPRTQIEIAIDKGEAVVTRSRNGLSKEIGRYGTDMPQADGRVDLATLADGTVTIARFSQERVLRKRLSLPYASQRTLRALLKYEVARHSPLDLEAVRWTFKITAQDRARNRSDVELQIVKHDTVETALRVCQAIGLTPHRIEFGAPGSAAASFDVAKVFRPRTIWRRHGIALLSALVAALVALNLAHDYTLRTAQARALAADVKRLKPETEAVRSLREQIAAIESGMRATATRKRGATLQTLSEITKLLPDDTWVFDFQAGKDSVTLRGFSAQAAGLIGLLDKSTLLRDAQFQAPLTKAGQEGKDRFDLSAKFRSVP